jgi:hypothetical protein
VRLAQQYSSSSSGACKGGIEIEKLERPRGLWMRLTRSLVEAV